jgi:hypothetical protein
MCPPLKDTFIRGRKPSFFVPEKDKFKFKTTKKPAQGGFILFGGSCWARTSGQFLKRELLYQLS